MRRGDKPLKKVTHTWICCQLGAREHYAVPRALHRQRLLDRLITDLWVKPNPWRKRLTAGLQERFHAELLTAKVGGFNRGALAFEALARFSQSGWKLIMKRNAWFQQRALSQLRNLGHERDGSSPVLFAYSYAARQLFQHAAGRRWQTVLGQIDPGPINDRLMGQLCESQPELRGAWRAAPARYWEEWREEHRLAGRILVNSRWSYDALIAEKVAAEKLAIVPLAYDLPAETAAVERNYPNCFSAQRPLRVLFLGQVSLLKGAGVVLQAAERLRAEPVHVDFVGPVHFSIPRHWQEHPRLSWHGAVPRSAVARHYRRADVFLLPTFSDGFGITQLEAQAWKLPVIASRFCGEVVNDGVNGIVLKHLSADAIAETLSEFLDRPERLREMSARCGTENRHSLDALGATLSKL